MLVNPTSVKFLDQWFLAFSTPALWWIRCMLMNTMTFHNRRSLLEWPGPCFLHLPVSPKFLIPCWAHLSHLNNAIIKHLLGSWNHALSCVCNCRVIQNQIRGLKFPPMARELWFHYVIAFLSFSCYQTHLAWLLVIESHCWIYMHGCPRTK